VSRQDRRQLSRAVALGACWVLQRAEVNQVLLSKKVLRVERDHRHDPVRAVLGALARP